MKSKFALSRRTLLRGAGASGIFAMGLPLLDAMLNDNATALAMGGDLPRRFGVWFWGNGVKLDRWVPTATGATWDLSPELVPFEKVKSRITVVSGTRCRTSGVVHHAGTAGMLSGASPDGGNPSTFALPSIDVVVKQQWKGLTTYEPLHVDALHLGIHDSRYDNEGTTARHLSHNGPNSVNPAQTAPQAVFDRLFSNGLPPIGGTPAPVPTVTDAERHAAARASVLDVVLQDAGDLKARLGTADRARLEQHMEGIRAVEKRLSALADPAQQPTPVGIGAGCKKGERPADLNGKTLEVRNQAMADVLALALACDLTRVFSYHFCSWPAPTFKELGHTEGEHALTHNEGNGQPQVHSAVTYMMKQFAYLLEKLDALPEGSGSLLQNCGILGTSEVSEGSSHGLSDMPIIVAGAAGGKLRTGLHVRDTQASSTQVHLAILQALGLPLMSFGAGDALSKAPLSAIMT